MRPNPCDDTIKTLLLEIRRIAVVGLSDRTDRPSYQVARYLRDAGYEIVPVNPRLSHWEGIPAASSLTAIAGPVDLIDVFRKPNEVEPVVTEALAKGCRIFWLQLGIRNDEAVQPLIDRGITVVQDLCLKIEHQRLLGAP